MLKAVKTVVCIPDDLLRKAEMAAHRLRISRSQLYAAALAEFLCRQDTEAVTERLNKVYSRRPATVDTLLHRAQLSSFTK